MCVLIHEVLSTIYPHQDVRLKEKKYVEFGEKLVLFDFNGITIAISIY